MQELANAKSEPVMRATFAELSPLLPRRNPGFNPFPDAKDVTPKLIFRQDMDLNRLNVPGGTPKRSTTFHETLREMFRQKPAGESESHGNHRIADESLV